MASEGLVSCLESRAMRTGDVKCQPHGNCSTKGQQLVRGPSRRQGLEFLSARHSPVVMTNGVHEALALLLDLSAEIRDPWWIIGGAATALITGSVADVHDIDVVLSPADARRLIAVLGLQDSTDGGTERFRSEVYATWRAPPVPVDLLGGFQVKAGDHWTPVAPKTRRPFQTPAGTVFLPSVEEQIEITKLLGRPRDFERINRLTST